MSKLGDFLERFYSPMQTFQSVHAHVRRTKSEVSDASKEGQPSRIGRTRRNRKPRGESVEDLVMWGVLPDKVRIESSRQKDDQVKNTIEIVNGIDTWKRFSDGTIEKGSARGRRSSEKCILPTGFQRHFDKGLLRECFAALSLEAIGDCQVAGRACLKIRAVHVPGTQLWPHWFSFSANEFLLAADVERAVLLSIAGVVDDQSVDTHEVVEVSFDEQVDDSLFTYEASTAEVVQPATPIAERMSLKAAAVRAPFTVLDPEYIPDRDNINEHATYKPSRPGDMEESLVVFYLGESSFESLWIRQSQQIDHMQQEELEWEDLDVDGNQMKISDPLCEDGLKVLTCEVDGTQVCITSDLPQDELIRIALSMRPVVGSNN